MLEDEDCENPEYFDDDDAAYDRWADNRVDEYFDRMDERMKLMKKWIALWDKDFILASRPNDIKERNELEQELVENLTGNKKHWLDINSIHGKWGSNAL